MRSKYKLKSTVWLDSVYTAILYFTGQRAHEWVEKIRIKHVIFDILQEPDWDNLTVNSHFIKISPEWRTKCTSEKTKNSWGAILKIHGIPSSKIQPYDVLKVNWSSKLKSALFLLTHFSDGG